MKFAFETSRLLVFETLPFTINEYFCSPKTLYVAFPKDCDIVHSPMPVVTVLMGDYCVDQQLLFADWMETASLYRRQGLATEVYIGLMAHLGGFDVSDGTDEGTLFLESIETM